MPSNRELCERMLELIPKYHSLLDCENFWDIPLSVRRQLADLGPTPFEMMLALASAKQKYLSAAKAGA